MNPKLNLVHQVVHLVFCRSHFYLRIQQSRRTNQLVNYDTFTPLQLILVRRSRHINRLTCFLLEFLELQRPVIPCRRQAETICH